MIEEYNDFLKQQEELRIKETRGHDPTGAVQIPSTASGV